MDLEEMIKKYEAEEREESVGGGVPKLTLEGKQAILPTGQAARQVEVFGEEIYVKLNSPKWQERSMAVTQIINGIDGFLEKENSNLAFNQVISMYSYKEKNNQTIEKHLTLYSALA